MAEPEFTKAVFAVRQSGDEALVLFQWLANFNASEPRPRHRTARRMSSGLVRSLHLMLLSAGRKAGRPNDRPLAWILSPRGVTARCNSTNTPSAAKVTSATMMQAAS